MMLNNRLFGSKFANGAARAGISRVARPVVYKILTRRQHTQGFQEHHIKDEDNHPNRYDNDRNNTSYQDIRTLNSTKLLDVLQALQSGLDEGQSLKELHDLFIFKLSEVGIEERSKYSTRTKLAPIINKMIDLSSSGSAESNGGENPLATPGEILQSAVQLQVADIVNFEKVMELYFKNAQVSEALSLWVSYLEYAATVRITAPPNYLRNFTVLAYVENCVKEKKQPTIETIDALLQTSARRLLGNLSRLVKTHLKRDDPRYWPLLNGVQALFLQNKDPNSITFLARAQSAALKGNTYLVDKSYNDVLKAAEFTGKKLNEETLVQFMGFYIKLGRFQTAMGFWNELIKAEITPSTAAWNNLLDVVSHLGPREQRLQQAEDLYEQIGEKDDESIVKMINIYTKFKAYDKLDEFVDKKKLESEAISQAFILSLLKRNETQRALELIDELKEKDIPLTLVTYNALLKNYIKNQDTKKARKLLNIMNAEEVKPDVATYSMIIDLTLKETRAKGDLINDDIISKILDEMKASGLDPNVYTMTSIIDGLSKDVAYEETALKLFQYLQENKLVSSVTYVAMISNSFDFGRTRQAELFFNDYIKAGYIVTIGIWNKIFEGFMRDKNSQKAFDYYRVMRKSDDRIFQNVNKFTFYFLLKAAALQNNVELANMVLSDIEEHQIASELSSQTLKVISSLSSNASVTIPKSVKARL